MFDDKIFSKSDEFNPDRFLGATKHDFPPYSFTPFSAGPRNCIGQHMTTFETKMVLVGFLKKFKVTLVEKVIF